MSAALSPALADRLWLIQLLSAETVAQLTQPLTDEQAARVNKALDRIESEWPVSTAIFSAEATVPGDEFPAAAEKILTEHGL